MERYQYVGRAGAGAFGTVWRCRNKLTNEVVAVKKLNYAPSPKELQHILREVALLQTAEHPNIVRLLEAMRSVSTGSVYLVFEHVEQTLSRLVVHSPGGLPVSQVRLVAWQVLEALTFLHQKKIVHCDIKPANILVSHSGVVKLCDFGLARSLEHHAGADAPLDAVTRWYRAPEVLLGGWPTAAQDMWSFGCLLAELLTSRVLFQGQDDVDQLALISRAVGPLSASQIELVELLPHRSGQHGATALHCQSPGDLASRLPKVPEDAMAVLRACLQPDPDLRASAVQVLGMPFFRHAAEQLEQLHRAHSMRCTASAPGDCPSQPSQRLATGRGAGAPAPGFAAVGATRQRPRPAVSALTANLRGKPTDDDGPFEDLLVQAEALAMQIAVCCALEEDGDKALCDVAAAVVSPFTRCWSTGCMDAMWQQHLHQRQKGAPQHQQQQPTEPEVLLPRHGHHSSSADGTEPGKGRSSSATLRRCPMHAGTPAHAKRICMQCHLAETAAASAPAVPGLASTVDSAVGAVGASPKDVAHFLDQGHSHHAELQHGSSFMASKGLVGVAMTGAASADSSLPSTLARTPPALPWCRAPERPPSHGGGNGGSADGVDVAKVFALHLHQHAGPVAKVLGDDLQVAVLLSRVASLPQPIARAGHADADDQGVPRHICRSISSVVSDVVSDT